MRLRPSKLSRNLEGIPCENCRVVPEYLREVRGIISVRAYCLACAFTTEEANVLYSLAAEDRYQEWMSRMEKDE